MVKARRGVKARAAGKPAVGLTMFGVTTPCVRQIVGLLDEAYDCLVFHATGIGGQSMEKLIDSGKVAGVIDVTTTEICDMMMGGVFPATDDRFGAVIRTRMPYVGSVGALDMVNFAAPETVPESTSPARVFYEHNPQVTLMRTTAEECADMGQWIGERLNQMEGQVRFFLPEGGVSALDAPGQAFHDPAARTALFDGAGAPLSARHRTGNLIRCRTISTIREFAAAVVAAFRALHGGGRPSRKREARRR
jgi:uncharacterized protein (UPF0261 family)